jgi:hypothetical protein
VAGETEVLGETLSQCHFVHYKSRMALSVPRGEWPAINRINYGTASPEWIASLPSVCQPVYGYICFTVMRWRGREHGHEETVLITNPHVT